jgi:NAD-dependent SIR2 family protein deacetylase
MSTYEPNDNKSDESSNKSTKQSNRIQRLKREADYAEDLPARLIFNAPEAVVEQTDFILAYYCNDCRKPYPYNERIEDEEFGLTDECRECGSIDISKIPVSGKDI